MGLVGATFDGSTSDEQARLNKVGTYVKIICLWSYR